MSILLFYTSDLVQILCILFSILIFFTKFILENCLCLSKFKV
jgi:hypothetical protein